MLITARKLENKKKTDGRINEGINRLKWSLLELLIAAENYNL